jgi:NADH:ubiquinone oxidoreductase subunit E
MSDIGAAPGCSCSGGIQKKEELMNVINDFADVPGALINVLHRAQGMYGYLPKDVLYEVSKGLDVPISEIMGVVTFYSFFSTVPKGKYNVMICMGTACYVKGAERVLEAFKKELDIDVGDTTGDKLFSLCSARCFGACGLAPAVDINGVVHRQVTDEKVPEIIAYYRDKESRGPAVAGL